MNKEKANPPEIVQEIVAIWLTGDVTLANQKFDEFCIKNKLRDFEALMLIEAIKKEFKK